MIDEKTFNQAKHSIRRADFHSSRAKDTNPIPEGEDLNLKQFKLIYGQKDFMLEHDTLECLEKYMLTEDLATRLLSSYKKVEETLTKVLNVQEPVLHLRTIKTPTLSAVSRREEQGVAGCAFQMRNCVKEPVLKEPILKESPIKKETIIQEPISGVPYEKPQYKYHAKSKDSVFTCVFVAINGEQSLFQKGTTPTNLLMNEKRLISEHLNKNPNALKASNYKLTIAKMNEIRCDLMTRPFMDKAAGGLVACAIYYKRPIYTVFEEIGAYLRFVSKEYVSDEEDDNNADNADDIILRIEKGGRLYVDQSGKSADIRANYMALEHYEKPMLGASAYKLDELVGIHTRIFGPSDVKMSKPEYYEKLLVKMTECVSARLV